VKLEKERSAVGVSTGFEEEGDGEMKKRREEGREDVRTQPADGATLPS
jgi:hypothetical protein